MIDLSLNEAETLAAKAARGAGFSWGLADEIGRAARAMATKGESWAEALVALARADDGFDAPTCERIARWRRGDEDVPGMRPICPVRTAALLVDDVSEFGTEPLRIAKVGQPVWLAAILNRSGMWAVSEGGLDLSTGDVTIRRGVDAPRGVSLRRAAIAPDVLAALNEYAARTYVPESERSRSRGAGGGRVDDE